MMEFPEDEMQLHDSRAQRARSADARSAAFLSEHFSFYGQLRRIKPWTARTYLPVHSNLASFAGVRNAPPCARSSEFYSYEIDLVRLGLFVLIVLVASWHWQLLLTTLLLLVPTLGQLLRWWHKHTEYCPLDHVSMRCTATVTTLVTLGAFELHARSICAGSNSNGYRICCIYRCPAHHAAPAEIILLGRAYRTPGQLLCSRDTLCFFLFCGGTLAAFNVASF